MADTSKEYLAALEAEVSMAHDAVNQLNARLRGQQFVMQSLLEYLGIDGARIEQWDSAMSKDDMVSIGEQTSLICQAIRRLSGRRVR